MDLQRGNRVWRSIALRLPEARTLRTARVLQKFTQPRNGAPVERRRLDAILEIALLPRPVLCRLRGMQRSKTGRIAGVGSLVFLAMLAGCGASAPPPKSQPSPLLARVLPSFEGKTLNLTQFDSAQADGRPMVV